MFHSKDPEKSRYMMRTHLAEMIAMLGPPPLEILKRGKRSSEFFSEDGK
jgi:serine/threonine-protein kinase SRPK3